VNNQDGGNASYTIQDGATIAVIGAGPAGSFFSILALKEARARGIRISPVIFDGKDFLKEGPQGCNMCAGVISRDLLRELENIGLSIPRDRVQRLIDSYIFHTIEGSHTVVSPAGKGPLPVIFRGNGPRFFQGGGNVSFDDYLLDQALLAGATIEPSYVKTIDFQGGTNGRPVIQWDGGSLTPDLVVVASGVSSQFAEKLSSCGIEYLPPRRVRAFQAELDLGDADLEKRLGNSIHVFSIGIEGTRFAAIIPKSRFATVSLVGNHDLDKRHFEAFLASPIVKQLFPPDWRLPARYCFCRPSLPITGGKGFFGNRLLIVGDASMSRYYKNGIDSAFRTARYAAAAVFGHGVSSDKLKRFYGAPVQKEFGLENLFARILFKLNDIVSPRRFWVNAHMHYACNRPEGKTAKTIYYLTWNLFTGQVSYRDILKTSLSPRFVLAMGIASLRFLMRRACKPSPWHDAD
jgi:flavin-dependent dehydrogenase